METRAYANINKILQLSTLSGKMRPSSAMSIPAISSFSAEPCIFSIKPIQFNSIQFCRGDKRALGLEVSVSYICLGSFNKSSSVAEMGDRGHNRHRPKRGGRSLCPFRGGSRVPV